MKTHIHTSSGTTIVSTPDAPSVPDVQSTQVMLSQPQDQALEYLMNGGTISEAAQYAGVSRSTLYRWITEDPDFQAVYDQWRKKVLDITEGQLLGLGESAVATLADAIRHHRDIKAAQFVVKQLAGLSRRK